MSIEGWAATEIVQALGPSDERLECSLDEAALYDLRADEYFLAIQALKHMTYLVMEQVSDLRRSIW